MGGTQSEIQTVTNEPSSTTNEQHKHTVAKIEANLSNFGKYYFDWKRWNTERIVDK